MRPEPPDAPAAPRVLVVDDAEEWRRIVERALAPRGYRVECVGGGEAALARVREAPPEVLLLDVDMPGVSGFDVLRALRAEEATAELPVVLLTAQDELESLVEGFALGANDYLVKPFRRPELLARVSAILRVQDLQRQVRRAAATAAQELRLARSVQLGLLPLPVPARPGLELAAFYRPCYHLGGDFLDLLPLPGDRTALFLADVSGHGIAAALVTSFLKAQLVHETQNAGGDLEPAALLGALHSGLRTAFGDTGLFATAVLLVFHPSSGRVQWSRAGHPLPLLQRASGEAEVLEDGDLPLGLAPESDFRVFDAHLEAGDRLFLFTDGLLEQLGQDGSEASGRARLREHIREGAGDDLPLLVRGIEEELMARTGGDLADDVSLLGLQRIPGDA